MFGLSEADALNEATAPHKIVREIHSGKLRNTFMGEIMRRPGDSADSTVPLCDVRGALFARGWNPRRSLTAGVRAWAAQSTGS